IHSLQEYPVLAYGLAWFWMVLVTNAYNLLDHADGLSGTVAVISASVLLSGSLMADDLSLAVLWLALIATLGGFLVFNPPPAPCRSPSGRVPKAAARSRCCRRC